MKAIQHETVEATDVREERGTGLLGQVKPLNFTISEPSREELERVIQEVRPAEQACGLCKIIVGKG
jgi:hypothetical protein